MEGSPLERTGEALPTPAAEHASTLFETAGRPAGAAPRSRGVPPFSVGSELGAEPEVMLQKPGSKIGEGPGRISCLKPLDDERSG